MSIADSSSQRIGDADRQQAIDALGEHWRAGRLDPAEHERRTTAAFQAVTRGDLDALFVDLPAAPASPPAVVGAPAGDDPHTSAAATHRSGGALIPADSWIGQHSAAIMGLTPFAALVLFFVTGQWLFFLLVPVMGVVLFAGDNDEEKERKRLKRDRRGRGE